MRAAPAIFLFIALPACPPQRSQDLFTGENFDGFTIAGGGSQPAYRVEDGAIHTQPGAGLLWYSRRKIGNTTLRVVFRMSAPNGNSGIFIRIPSEPPDEEFAIHRGIEVQIDDLADDWHCTGVLYSMTKALARPSRALDWNVMDITLDGLRTIVKLNGVLVTDYDGISPVAERAGPWEPERGPRPEYGYVAFQHHDDDAVISFREISVRDRLGWYALRGPAAAQ